MAQCEPLRTASKRIHAPPMSRRDKVAALRGSGFATIDPVEAQQKDLDGVHISGEMNAMVNKRMRGFL